MEPLPSPPEGGKMAKLLVFLLKLADLNSYRLSVSVSIVARVEI